MIRFLKKRFSLALSLVFFVFAVLVATFLTAVGVMTLLQHCGIVAKYETLTKTELYDGDQTLSGEGVIEPNDTGAAEGNADTAAVDMLHVNAKSSRLIRPLEPLGAVIALCILLGTSIAAFLSGKTLKPIRKVIAATQEVAGGNFDVRVELKGIVELEELSEGFNKMVSELSGIETLRSDFVNNFSHEFKTPIVSIRGFARLLKEGNLSPEEQEEYLTIILEESERLVNLSTSVLNLSKLEHIEIVSEQEEFCLDEQIRRVILLMEPRWSKKSISMNVEMADVLFMGNEDLMEQIWVNLLDNAIKFSFNGGSIHINLEQRDDDIIFRIQDEGCGMEEQTRHSMFDKFYQGDVSHKESGNGLGLPLVKRIVNLCGGTVEVESEKGQGSLFTVILPCKKGFSDN